MALSFEEQTRIDLAAAFRIIAHLGMHEAVANHFSAAVSPDGKQFLMNPKWKHFSRLRASDLLLLNAEDTACGERDDVDATAWSIHGQIHQRLPETRVVMHLHPVYTTSVACLAQPHSACRSKQCALLQPYRGGYPVRGHGRHSGGRRPTGQPADR